MEPLKAGLEHRSIDFVEKLPRDVHHARRINSQEVAVVREVVNRAKRNAVDDRRVSEWVAVVDDVRRLQQR